MKRKTEEFIEDPMELPAFPYQEETLEAPKSPSVPQIKALPIESMPGVESNSLGAIRGRRDTYLAKLRGGK